MPAKRQKGTRNTSVQSLEAAAPVHPEPPNIFLYIQLAKICPTTLPKTIHPLEIHLRQGDSLIIKCDEHYNTEGIIRQNEFNTKPTFTLVFQQDNLDRINHAANNPLLVMFYMRQSDITSDYNGEEAEDGEFIDDPQVLSVASIFDDGYDEHREIDYHPGNEQLVLLSAGYLDVIKLFGHHRSMIRECLYLYPVPDVPQELRTTVHTDWDLYTLLPIAKELTFTNMAFITFESIYNLKEEYLLNVDSMIVKISFRSKLPNQGNEFQLIPLCEFSNLEQDCISKQFIHHVFEYFRQTIPEYKTTGLKSTMEVEMHKLFSQLALSEGLEVEFAMIDTIFDEAIICNGFHRYILTKAMADGLCNAIVCQQYDLAVEVFQSSSRNSYHKVFQGILDPAIMLYPGVQTMRFAVALEYVGKRKSRAKRQTIVSILSQRSGKNETMLPTFAIIKLCLLAPIGAIYQELKVFRESFISQNRLLFCDQPYKESLVADLADTQRESYARFDKFMRDTISFILSKSVKAIEDRKPHFCCDIHNLTNILLKLLGSVFNTRTPTKTSVEFNNLCADAYNELEPRIYRILNRVEDAGFDNFVVHPQIQMDEIIDYINAIKLLYAVKDDRMAQYVLEKACTEKSYDDRLNFFMVIVHMERCEYADAKAYFNSQEYRVPENYEYFADWIKLYLKYLDTRDDPETAANSTECLLRSLFEFTKANPLMHEGWILLFCYYMKFKYEPGCAYARWQGNFATMQMKQGRQGASTSPYSLWGIFLTILPEFSTIRGTVFFDVVKTFVRLGLYEFAQVVFSVVEDKCSEANRYMINTQLKILLNRLEDKFVVRTFKFGKDDRAAAMNAQLNGNVEYYRGNMAKAAIFYAATLELPVIDENERDYFVVSKMRLGYIAYENGDYYKVIQALSYPYIGKLIPMVSSYLMGKAFYKLDNLDMALQCFANCTRSQNHVPIIWGFLALINLRLGENYKALECWKYAKIDPLLEIDDEMIFEELAAIDCDTVDMYIDVPGFHSDVSFFE
ncbi:uncharacterized protein [Drosophila pseudoobscura]|uniref:Tetratricopeptide repeat protein 18 n=1 Tax=Drosophila pseudoobscura pseudoobscura TaxID=46245 RepID=A0A6I8UXT5_DROPS|nr:uncharacterized protein LOC6903173 [Drosophila pseudoobscura]